MENPDLTKWLEMVWDALAEHDEVNRDILLDAADTFLEEDNQESDCTALACVGRKKKAA